MLACFFLEKKKTKKKKKTKTPNTWSSKFNTEVIRLTLKKSAEVENAARNASAQS